MADYVDKEIVKSLIRPVINVGDTSNTTLNDSTAGGFTISTTMFDYLYSQGQFVGINFLRKYYAYPLQNNEGSQSINDWDDLDKNIIIGYLLAKVILQVLRFTLTSTGGTADAMKMMESYQSQSDEYEKMLFQLDQNKGQTYPALPNTLWANFYLTRQENPTLKAVPPNTRYQVGIQDSDNLFIGEYVNGYNIEE